MDSITLKDVVHHPSFAEEVKVYVERYKNTPFVKILRPLYRKGIFDDVQTFIESFEEVIEKRSNLSSTERRTVEYIGMLAAHKTYIKIKEQNENG